MGTGEDWILTLNAGSSSLKFAAYDLSAQCKLASGQVAAIGPDARLVCGNEDLPVSAKDHAEALVKALDYLSSTGLSHVPTCAGHRVVHGGAQSEAAEITRDVRRVIERATALAPLHNPPALNVIDALGVQHPKLRQVVCFDTAFHAENSLEATTYAIPQEFRDKGIRRYGFHGLSYASLVRRFTEITGAPLPRRVLALHLGAGASLAAIVDGKGVATTMGFSPMDGLVMATRSGAIDAGVLLHLMRQEGMGANELDELLNKKSGLLALSGGEMDMKSLLQSENPEAEFAISHYCYWACRHAGSMIAAMQGVDGLIFTGGIGENAMEIRERILKGLEWVGVGPDTEPRSESGQQDFPVKAWIIPSDEEGEIAQLARQTMNSGVAN